MQEAKFTLRQYFTLATCYTVSQGTPLQHPWSSVANMLIFLVKPGNFPTPSGHFF